jgi:protein gp37
MGDSSTIEWTDATWNPVTGCTKVSPGCAHCYAEGIAFRGLGRFGAKYSVPSEDQPGLRRKRHFDEVQCHDDALDAPLRWRKPRRIFVNSMSDLFHEDVPDAFIDRVFAVMALAPQHTFQILTKRAERMRAYLSGEETRDRIADVLGHHYGRDKTARSVLGQQFDLDADTKWPLPNVWLGVSVENQRFADERIPLLLRTPAAVRFLSLEPLLEQVDLTNYLWTIPGARLNGLHWLIVGGESGPNARPFDLAWARWTVAQGRSSGVPVFVKQFGAVPVIAEEAWHCAESVALLNARNHKRCAPGDVPLKFADRKGGDPSEWPADLRVREYPEVRA